MLDLSSGERAPYEPPTLVKRDRLSMITAQTLCTRTMMTDCVLPGDGDDGGDGGDGDPDVT